MNFHNGFFVFLSMDKLAPIGFFDSGYGGLTVLKEVLDLLPQYDYLYLGDNQRAPYGVKTLEEVYQYTWECVQELFSQGCELVILACNTASAKALRRIQQNDLHRYPGKRVLGVVRPSAEIVGDLSEKDEIIVLGTQGTISSNTYLDEFSFFSPQTKVHQYACHDWVRIIESGEHHLESGRSLIRQDLIEIQSLYPNADVVLLGCTHYPIIKSFIEKHFPENIKIVSQGEFLATSLKSYLERHPWMREKITTNGSRTYLTTGDATKFQEQASTILSMNVVAKQVTLNQ